MTLTLTIIGSMMLGAFLGVIFMCILQAGRDE